MASLLLHHHGQAGPRANPPRIHGVAEITAIAQGETFNEIPLSGLYWHELASYLDQSGRSGLCTAIQRAGRTSGPRGSKHCRSCCRSYVSSGMPVIFPINATCMHDMNTGLAGKLVPGIYKSNLSDAQFARRIRNHPLYYQDVDHAVVVVGGSRSADRDEFLINDPAGFPFIRATARAAMGLRERAADPVHGEESGVQHLRGLRGDAEAVVIGLEPHQTSPRGKAAIRHIGLFDVAHRAAAAASRAPAGRVIRSCSPVGPHGGRGDYHLWASGDCAGRCEPADFADAPRRPPRARVRADVRERLRQFGEPLVLGPIRGRTTSTHPNPAMPQSLSIWDAQRNSAHRPADAEGPFPEAEVACDGAAAAGRVRPR